MKATVFYPGGDSAALTFACKALSRVGIPVSPLPCAAVTHLLLPVPSFDRNGDIREGGALAPLLYALPETVTILGGKLEHPLLLGRKTVDLLADEQYLAENAAITADCAIRIAGSRLSTVFRGCPVLILGWGRIGKCLAQQLGALGAAVTVAARKEHSLAGALSLGFHIREIGALSPDLSRYRVIFNTVPAGILNEEQLSHCQSGCILIDLASTPGMEGANVIHARGLPGRYAPESSGELIARSCLRLIGGEAAL